MLSSQELAAFLAVADCGSFSAAAGKLGRVQSNVTARIRSLEQRLGAVLFDRGRQGASLTPAGETLLKRARLAADLLAEGEQAVRDQAAGRTLLRLGSMESTAGARLPAVLLRARERRPDLQLQLSTGTTDELIRDVLERRLDAAFVAGGTDLEALQAQPVFEERLVLVEPTGRPAARPLLAFRQGCTYRSVAERWLRASGRAPVEIMEFGTIDGILGCAAVGLGIAVLPEAVVRISLHAPQLTVSPLPEPYGSSVTMLVSRRDDGGRRPLVELLLEAASS
ncbi:DNA-binding transcriptional regulator, LysR family [Tistlia consotensis]|uniref:DNA-binding transcriptional regulator, LysR family n=1 Tax=Tistlia consotensis USBA 355 TaxID=560819 RepID=A0A1Y6BD40_9PROT|nr:LysR family transcriptional regulator [Tistlia consotensis]SME98346.1 DNA-binding transcriptional regulator, LysR family [Tistlia consotensis USBA 355]SNR57691.1 DNA-binding transcriptional regulator, LysR family [Tistlia consotensis]